MAKRNTMIGNFEIGGLNMIDIENYLTLLRATWISRFVSRGMDHWKLIVYHINTSDNFVRIG